MKRRAFLKTSLAATSLAALSPFAAKSQAAEKTGTQEYYEWRSYQLKGSSQKEKVDGYLKNALIPALNRLGCKPVGAFTVKDATEITALHVLIPYPSLEVFGSAAAALDNDATYQKAAESYLQATKADPAYVRIENSFMKAFAGMPKIELQPFSLDRKPRMFEIRIYEAHSEFKCAKKVEMFNKGEMQVMRDTGLGPVFFGHTLLGTKFPNMTYMLSAESKEDHDNHWKAFGGHPEWNRMKALPEYADTVSTITNYFLVPTEYSQI